MGTGKGTASDEWATDSEIEEAIRALSDADANRLSKVGKYYAWALAGMGLGISGDDLLQEAISRTVAGCRRWKKSISFVRHLTKTMQSVANHAPDELVGLTAVTATAEDEAGCLDGIALRSPLPDAERILAVREQVEEIAKRFDDDDAVGLVLECLARGMTGPEIQADLGVSETQYETIMTRLRRGVDRKGGWRQ